jgi:hypothetical protein
VDKYLHPLLDATVNYKLSSEAMTEARSGRNRVWVYMLASVIAIPGWLLLARALGASQWYVAILYVQVVCWLFALERYLRQPEVEQRSRAQKIGLIISGLIVGLWTLMVLLVYMIGPINIAPFGM